MPKGPRNEGQKDGKPESTESHPLPAPCSLTADMAPGDRTAGAHPRPPTGRQPGTGHAGIHHYHRRRR